MESRPSGEFPGMENDQRSKLFDIMRKNIEPFFWLMIFHDNKKGRQYSGGVIEE